VIRKTVTLVFCDVTGSTALGEALGLDGVLEGPVAMAGCGKQRPTGSSFEPRFTRHLPRELRL
jgi:hypothetical protein